MTTKNQYEYKNGKTEKMEKIEENENIQGVHKDLDKSIDKLQALIDYDYSAKFDVVKGIYVPSFEFEFSVKPLKRSDMQKIADQSRSYPVEQRDGVQDNLVVFKSVIDPDLSNKKLFDKFSIPQTKPELLVQSILLPGEISILSSLILEISGFQNDFRSIYKVSENL